MDHVTYDEEGNPVVRSSSRSRSNSVAAVGGRGGRQRSENLVGIFEIEGASYDVLLEEERVSWVPITGSAKGSRNKKSRSSIMKKLRGAKSQDGQSRTNDIDGCIQFRDMFGVMVKRLQRDNHKDGEGICEGISIYVYDKKEANRYKERVLVLGHPSEDICTAWVDRITKALQGFSERPKHIKVFLQPYAGKRQSRSIFKSKVKPLLEAARVTYDMTEVAYNEHIKQQLIHIEPAEFDCVVCVGGDGTVHKVMNGLMNQAQEDEPIELRSYSTPCKCPLPLGIIPTGTVNQIVHSMQGIEDVITATIHIILGHRKAVNVCALYHKDKIHRWAFNCHYGFFGSVLAYLSRYAVLGDRRLEASFMKALTKKKFRSYEVEVSYIPAGGDTAVVKQGDPCTAGCSVCDGGPLENSHGSHTDDIQELDPLTASSTSSTIIDKWWGRSDPLATSCTSSVIMDLSKEVPFKSIKGEFVSVSVFSVAGLSELSPRGMSPLTHTNDGLLDLVLVKPVDRKEFVRFLKRHGNAKNQFDFPFVETYRCKEINFHVRLKETWKHQDYGFNEITYEMDRQNWENQRMRPETFKRSKSVDVIEELCLSDSDDEDAVEERSLKNGSVTSGINSTDTGSGSQKPHFKAFDLFRKVHPKAREERLKRKQMKQKEKKEKAKETKAKRSSPDEQRSIGKSTNGSADVVHAFEVDDDSEEETSGTVSRANSVIEVSQPRSAYRPSLQEMERERRRKKRQAKDEKKRAAAEAIMKSVWNLDTEVCINLDLEFRIHTGLLQVFGEGVSSDSEYGENKHSCLSIMK